MNERIQELAEQAGLYVDLDGTPWPRAMSAEDCEAAYKKFAELIVRECCEVAHCNFHVDGLTLGGIMKKHFGVKK
jgi:hypothetical protein